VEATSPIRAIYMSPERKHAPAPVRCCKRSPARADRWRVLLSDRVTMRHMLGPVRAAAFVAKNIASR
jgi:hypothetical protein